MTVLEIVGVVVMAILITSIFYFGFKKTGPWGSFWTFFLVLWLGIWAADVWIDPIGPIYWGVAWLDFFVVGILFAVLLVAAMPPARYDRDQTSIYPDEKSPHNVKDQDRETAAIGAFFWVLLVLFVVVIAVGVTLA